MSNHPFILVTHINHNISGSSDINKKSQGRYKNNQDVLC